jgi:hypothetical protein
MVKVDELPKFVRDGHIDSIYKFILSIDWSESWLQGLIGFHLALLVFVFLTRKMFRTQAVLFILLLCSVLSAEKVNEFAAKNFAAFSRLQYFDSYGMFISLVWSTPILINSVIILINWFVNSGELLVKVKRTELAMKEKKKN